MEMQDNNYSKKENDEKSSPIGEGSIPSRCPFSGVSFDPSLLQEWENKIKLSAGNGDQVSQLHSIHKLMMQQSTQNDQQNKQTKAMGAEDNETDVPIKKKTTMRRIHITNSQSKRTKDILLEPSSSHKAWDAIYNNPSVKDANIRKWNSETVQGVKDGTKEIRLEVCSSSSHVASKVYTLADLKELSTKELFSQSLSSSVDGSDTLDIQEDFVLNLQLCCVDIWLLRVKLRIQLK